MQTVYQKLLQMAKEEAQGRKKANLKEVCNGISKRFRLTHKEIYIALKELRGKEQVNLARNTLKFNSR